MPNNWRRKWFYVETDLVERVVGDKVEVEYSFASRLKDTNPVCSPHYEDVGGSLNDIAFCQGYHQLSPRD